MICHQNGAYADLISRPVDLSTPSLLLTATLCFNALDITALENPPEWAELEPGKGVYRISFGCLQRLAVPNNSRLLSLD
jgi:hypothetical protein